MAGTATASAALAPPAQLATWLALNEPDLFVTLARRARVANVKQGVRARLAQLADDSDLDFGDDVDTDIDTEDLGIEDEDLGLTDDDLLPVDDSSLTADAENAESSAEAELGLPATDDLTADLTAESDQDIQAAENYLLSPEGSDVSSAVASTPTSSGQTVGQAVTSSGSSVPSAVSSVSDVLSSPSGLKALASLATSYFQSQAQNSALAAQNAAASQAILAAQMSAAAAGSSLLPVTSTVDATTGLVTPLIASEGAGGTSYTPTTLSELASMLPAGASAFLSQYGFWIAIGLVVLGVIWAAKRIG